MNDVADQSDAGDERVDGPTDTESTGAVTSEQTGDSTAQSAALRRQQQYVGGGVAVLAGISVTVAGIQQFPGFPLVASLAAGIVTTGAVLFLLSASVFHGESA